MKSPCLTVCVCVGDGDECAVNLNEIAAGHVFGTHQRLKLLLHGPDPNSLHDLVSSIQDSCYHLVDEVSVAPPTVRDYDVTLVLLSQNNPFIHSSLQHQSYSSNIQDTKSLASYITTITNFLGNKVNDTSKILVLGPRANTAASLLSNKLKCVGGNQLLAFQTNQDTSLPASTDRTRHYSRGQYKTADILCQDVSGWWTGTKDTSKTINAGVKFFRKKNSTAVQDGGVFFSVPVEIIGEKTFKVDPKFYIDSDELKKVVCETEIAVSQMRNKENKETKIISDAKL